MLVTTLVHSTPAIYCFLTVIKGAVNPAAELRNLGAGEIKNSDKL